MSKRNKIPLVTSSKTEPPSSPFRPATFVVSLLVLGGISLGYLLNRSSDEAHEPADELHQAHDHDSNVVLRTRLGWFSQRKTGDVSSPGALLQEEPYLSEDVEEELEEFFPRDPLEWQGLLVRTTPALSCETSSRCANAMACVDNQCGACTSDDQCGSGEICSMDHCLQEDNVACRSRQDCDESQGELCLLSGYTSTARGNEETVAYCAGSTGEALISRGVTEEELSEREAELGALPPPEASPMDQLVASLRSQAR